MPISLFTNTMSTKQIISYSIGVLVAAFWITAGVFNLLELELVEYKLVELGWCEWLSTPIITRIFIGYFFGLGSLFIMGYNHKKAMGLLSLFFGLVLATEYSLTNEQSIITKNLLDITGNSVIDINLLAVTILLSLSLLLLQTAKPLFNFKWMYAIMPVASIVTVYILNPVFPIHITDSFEFENGKMEEEYFETEEEQEVLAEITKGKKLVVFFSTSCGHCALTAQKLMVAKQVKNFPPIKVFYFGPEEEVELFHKHTNTNFDYFVFYKTDLFKMTEGSVPYAKLMKNGVVLKNWSGGEFNYKVLQNLTEQNYFNKYKSP